MLVYYNATLRLSEGYDFKDWEGLSPATLAQVLGGREKGVFGVKAKENQPGDLLRVYGSGTYERSGEGWTEVAASGRDVVAGARRAGQRRRRRAARSATSTGSPAVVDVGPPGIDPQSDKIITEELEHALRAIERRRARAKELLTFASGPADGEYARVVNAILGTVAKRGRKVQVIGVETEGSIENALLLGRGQADYARACKATWRGSRPPAPARSRVDGPLKRIAALGSLYPEPVHIVVSAKSGIRRVEDLRGKRVDLGTPQSGTRINAVSVLQASGVAPKEFAEARAEGPQAAAQQLRAGRIDAFFTTVGAPAHALQRLAAEHPIRLVPISPGAADSRGERAAGPGAPHAAGEHLSGPDPASGDRRRDRSARRFERHAERRGEGAARARLREHRLPGVRQRARGEDLHRERPARRGDPAASGRGRILRQRQALRGLREGRSARRPDGRGGGHPEGDGLRDDRRPAGAGRLYTAIVPMVVYALLGSSRPLSVSTTTTIAILTGAELGRVAPGGDAAELIAATATLALLVGAMLVAAPALLRLGFVANFISEPVLTGFKAGIGVVIVVDQLPKLLGVHIEKAGFFRDIVVDRWRTLPDASGATVLLALVPARADVRARALRARRAGAAGRDRRRHRRVAPARPARAPASRRSARCRAGCRRWSAAARSASRRCGRRPRASR